MAKAIRYETLSVPSGTSAGHHHPLLKASTVVVCTVCSTVRKLLKYPVCIGSYRHHWIITKRPLQSEAFYNEYIYSYSLWIVTH